MAPGPRTDEELDQLLAKRDPVDRSRLAHRDVDAALERLYNAIAVPTTVAQRRRWRPVRQRLVLFGTAVGALAGILLIAGALLPAGGVQSVRLGAPPATAAAAVLSRAAKTAMQRTQLFPTARQYQYLAVEEGKITGFGGGATTGPPGTLLWAVNLWQSDTKQDWFKPNGSGRERILDTGRGFLTSRDAAIARAHHTSLDHMLPNQSVDGTYPAGGIGWSFTDPAGLPTSVGALLYVIDHQLATEHVPQQQRPAWAFDTLGELLFESNSPALRASLYRALEHLPGVQLVGWRYDRIGRRGLAVAITHPPMRGTSQTRDELLFDPATSDVLQEDQVLVAPWRWSNKGTLPTGTVESYTVFLRRGIVNSITALPGGGQLPYHPSVGARTR
jgi:hypothetical protein